MQQRTETQYFDELATEIDEAIKSGDIDPGTINRELASSCLRRVSHIRRGKPAKSLIATPCHLTEIDAELKIAFGFSNDWNATVRDEVFAGHIETIDLVSEGAPANETKLADAAIFLRAIVAGLEHYKMKLARSSRPH